jgi:asparagine synthase (glutamine-hydrolysing)
VTAIAGFWRFDGEPGPAANCARMLTAQKIYGPHDGRQWSAGLIAMGRQIFRTLPEDIHDSQPLQSRDGRLTLVADVRLDNRDELGADLGLLLADAEQLCDAAILLATLERWGAGALDRLVGEFAFALWDAHAQEITLARDFLGQRPLHYYRGTDFFAFASMPKGLHALSEVPYEPDEEMVAALVTLMPRAGPRSFFKDILRVEPAHVLTVTRDGQSSRRYWNPKRPGVRRAQSGDYAEGLRRHLDIATRSQLRGADGVVGTQLSAGFDSSSVTATAARLLAPSGGKVIAFTAVPREGYDGPSPRNRFGDEGPLAAATAAMYPNIEHVLVRPDGRSTLDALDRAFFLAESPILNLCNTKWGQAINRAARDRKLNIMLIGQMGNMTVSYYGLELLPELLRAGRFIRLWHEASQLVAKTGMRWRGAAVQTFGPFTPLWLWQWANEKFLHRSRDVLNYSAIHADRLAELDLATMARQRDLDFSYRPRKDGFATRLWVMARVDSGNGKKAALAGYGFDYRDPTADKRLVEYCLSIPTEEYLSNGVTRSLAKRALADRLPQAVLDEPKKGYQAVDWHEGVTAARAEIAAELDRLAASAPAAKTLDIERMRRLVENWPTSGWERDEVMQPYRLALLRGIAAGHFLRKASGANQ